MPRITDEMTWDLLRDKWNEEELLQAQLTHCEPLIRQAEHTRTLKAVGEWIETPCDKKWHCYSHGIAMEKGITKKKCPDCLDELIKAFKNGEEPEGMKDV